MDVVDAAGMGLHPLIQKVLEGAHRQLCGGLGDGDLPHLGVEHIGDGMTLALAVMGAGVGGQEVLHQLIRIHIEADPVDGLEL